MSDHKFNNPWDDDNKKKEDLEKAFKKGQEKIVELLGKKNSKSNKGGDNFNFNFDFFSFGFPTTKILLIILLVIITSWLSTGFYTVQPDEEAVVMRFGEYSRTGLPGLNYKLPSPIETVQKVSVTRIRKEEIGFRSSGKRITSREQLLESTVSSESQMLTTDENIVDINFEVQWIIQDVKKFLFNVRDSTNSASYEIQNVNTVKGVAESAMREIIGLAKVTDVLAEERSKTEHDAKSLMQQMLDNYNMGVSVVRVQLLRVDPPQEVIDAYRDVQNAKQDKEREINQAYSYRNDIMPRARGEAENIIQDAEAYKNTVIASATGESKRFESIYEQYRNAKDVTRKRMYLETMEQVLDGIDKILIDKNTSNVVPFLPLNDTSKKTNG